MANTAQARKRARQAVKQNSHNSSLRSELRTEIKKVVKAISAGDKAAAQAVYKTSVSAVDRIADKKIIRTSRQRCRLVCFDVIGCFPCLDGASWLNIRP